MIRHLVSRTKSLATVFALIRSSSPYVQASWIGKPTVTAGATTAAFVSLHNKNNNDSKNNLHSLSRLSTTRPFSSSSTTSLNMSTKRVLVPIADGSEEIETTCITDTLVRFGAEVTVASAKADGSLLCKMSRGIQVQADTTVAQAASEWDLIVLPGGMPGTEHLRDCPALIDLLQKQKEANKLYGAVCAAPAVVLASHNLLPTDGTATCYPAPGFREKISAIESNDEVVVSGNVITSQGPGTSLKFALKLGELLFGKEKRDEIAKAMLVQ